MNENEVFDVLNSFKEAIDVLISEIDALKAENSALNEKVDSLKDTLFDEILEPARLAMENREREDRFEEFNEKYGEKLGAYDPTIQSIQNDKDYSLSRDVFDEYDALPEPKPDEAGFVDSSIAKVEEQIEAIKENLGIASDADVEIKQDGETGDTEIVADGEVVAKEENGELVTTDEETEETSEKTEEPKADEDGQLELEGIEEVTDSPDEVKKFEEELKKTL